MYIKDNPLACPWYIVPQSHGRDSLKDSLLYFVETTIKKIIIICIKTGDLTISKSVTNLWITTAIKRLLSYAENNDLTNHHKVCIWDAET